MAAIKELIRKESDNTISFGDYTLDKKTKLDNFEYQGDLYKVKTFGEITKLEKNGSFVYDQFLEQQLHLKETEKGMEFKVEGPEDAQITVGLEADTEYEVYVGGGDAGNMKTNLGGKLSLSVELDAGSVVDVKIVAK